MDFSVSAELMVGLIRAARVFPALRLGETGDVVAIAVSAGTAEIRLGSLVSTCDKALAPLLDELTWAFDVYGSDKLLEIDDIPLECGVVLKVPAALSVLAEVTNRLQLDLEIGVVWARCSSSSGDYANVSFPVQTHFRDEGFYDVRDSNALSFVVEAAQQRFGIEDGTRRVIEALPDAIEHFCPSGSFVSRSAAKFERA